MRRGSIGSPLRARLSRAGRGTKPRPFLRWAYTTSIAAEVAAARAQAWRKRLPPTAPEGLTLAVKTFERPDVLRRLLKSVRRVYSGPIIVADDGANPFVSDDPFVKVLALPFDTGVGAGRNALIDAVDTEYIWMADDDMIVLPDFDVSRPLAYLARNPQVDLCGGRVVNLPQWETPDYAASVLFSYSGTPLEALGTLVDGLPVYYKVPNFYVARIEKVRSVRYDDHLTRVDHNDFFTSAYGKLVCVYDATWTALHAHSLFDPHYQSFRMRQAADFAYLARKWRD